MLKRLAAMVGARGGAAAIEFALLAPIMVLMFFAVVELSAAVDCRTRVNNVASTAADLVAQETIVSTSDMTNVFSALNAIIYPFPSAAARIVITSVVDNGSGGGKVAWSNAQNGTARTVGSAVTVPAGLITTGGSVILAEITYTYTSPTTQFLTGTVTMSNSFFARPRRSATVTHT